jgi:multiple sugar transport system permease protein
VKRATAKPLGTLGATLLGLVVSALFLWPLLWAVLTAFKEGREVFSGPLLPTTWRFSNFVAAWRAAPFGRYLLNSLLVSSSITALVLVTSCLSAFAFARLRFPGRALLFMLALGTLMIPFDVLLVPNYLTVRALGLLDSYAALILPFAASGFGIFVMRQAFKGSPQEIEDAARIDGAGSLTYLVRILVPMHLAPLSAVGVLTFLGAWNAYVWPLIVTSSDALRPVQVGLAHFRGVEGSNIPLMMAATVIAVAPVLLAYALAQRWFIKSAAASGLKG